jgi:hypothetical protein
LAMKGARQTTANPPLFCLMREGRGRIAEMKLLSSSSALGTVRWVRVLWGAGCCELQGIRRRVARFSQSTPRSVLSLAPCPTRTRPRRSGVIRRAQTLCQLPILDLSDLPCFGLFSDARCFSSLVHSFATEILQLCRGRPRREFTQTGSYLILTRNARLASGLGNRQQMPGGNELAIELAMPEPKYGRLCSELRASYHNGRLADVLHKSLMKIRDNEFIETCIPPFYGGSVRTSRQR